MKLLLFIDSLVGAGAQRQLVNLALGLDARGHEITIATYAPSRFFLVRLEGSGVQYRNFGKGSRFDPMPLWHLYRTVGELRPDAVIAFLRTPCVYAELVKLLRPSMRLIVSERAGVRPGGFTRGDWLAGLLHHVATAVTANSHAYLDALLARHPRLERRASVVYNGLDEVFLANGDARLAQPVDTGPGPQRWCVVAARATAQKAPLVMAQALSELVRRGVSDIAFDWVGPVDHDSELVRLTVAEIERGGLGGIWTWRGACASTVELYPHYDALISPSLYEGVSNTMCEALCSGLPVVVTDIADNARILEAHAARFVCEADDPLALADALQRLHALDAPARWEIGRQGQARARELFSMQRFVDRWETLCERLVAPDSADA